MPSRKEGLLVLYPEYFDSTLTRKQGRRVPRSVAREKPTLEDIVRAVKAAELEPDPATEPKSAHPQWWFEARGRVLLRKKYNKQKTLMMVARNL